MAFSCAPDERPQIEENAQSVVYGADDRQDVYAHPDQQLVAWAVESSAALVILPGVIDESSPSNIRFNARTLSELISGSESRPLCSDERFPEQLTAADCSATLIAPELILTAGHCVDVNNCSATSVVFDYHMISASQLQTITSDDVYSCRDVVVRKSDELDDYTIFRLNRPVVGRTPAQVADINDRLSVGDRLIMNGYPTGIPLKIDDGGRVRDIPDDLSFEASLDSFGGNSGSGVFDAGSRRLFGVLSAGEQDYAFDEGRQCIRVNDCPENGCSGETVVYAHRAISALCQTAPVAALCNGCGDDVCEATNGESSITCPFDCGTVCGDGTCNGDEAPTNCEADCGRCGNLVCDSDESVETCCTDCGCTEANNMCIDNACLVAGGNVCNQAIELAAVSMQVVEGTTQLASDTLVPSDACAPDFGGPDVVFRIDLPEGATLRASVDASFDTVLYVQRTCGSTRSQLSCNDDRAEGNLNSSITLFDASGPVFLVVDGYDSVESGVFQLNVQVSAGANNPGSDDDEGGCRCVTSSTPAPGWAALLLVFGLFARTSRRKKAAHQQR
ncbi:MAG: serine protease [Myxococcota bacterium]